ncbi:cation transporter [Kineosporia sp. R_H_3]|uniref:cation transporter n=1 Tax=Kineosporia sp. R_H_3 TaxID=1961848 RepID=UPI001E5B9EB8|nr:cation transporter [Kineosporia sp. R_H_3]
MLLVLSVIIMPVLAAAQRRVGTRLGDPVMLADAAETKMCVLLSISTLLGLVLFAITGQGWRDPVAGFVIAAFAINQGPDAWEGEFVDADDDDDDD